MIEIQWPAQDSITTSKGLIYREGWGDCLAACKNAVALAIKKESTISWDKQMENRHPLLSDTTVQGAIRAKVARAAFKQYDPTRDWDQLNPQVREDWLQKIKAVMDALKQGLVVSSS